MQGRELQWPPFCHAEDGGVYEWDALVPPDSDEDDTELITWRELAHEICNRRGGIEDYLDHQWLYQGGRPAPEPELPAAVGADDLCEGCGQRPGEIDANLGRVCWPCYETDDYS